MANDDIDLTPNPLGYNLSGFAGTVPEGLGSSPNTVVQAPLSQEEKIRGWATKYGVDPEKAVGIARAEGLNAWGPSNPNAGSTVDIDPATGKSFSFGDFQLNIRNGLGVAAKAAGLDPTDPAQRDAVDEWAIKQMAVNGFGPWKGDKYMKGLAEPSSDGNGNPTSAPTAPSASPTTGGLALNPKGLYQLAMLQALAPLHKFTPVDYDPFKVMPHQSGVGN